MKAPDKIYIVETEAARGTVLLACKEYNDFCKNHETQEYIRKDALLKWAKTLKERWEKPPMSNTAKGCIYMLEQVIDKLNSM